MLTIEKYNDAVETLREAARTCKKAQKTSISLATKLEMNAAYNQLCQAIKLAMVNMFTVEDAIK